MEELRKQFEKWCQCERNGVILKIGIDGEYNSRESQIMWEAWQASRAAIVIDLPPKMGEHQTMWDGTDWNQMHEHAVTAIRAAGLRVKEK